jgi:PPM family protein phosphatase
MQYVKKLFNMPDNTAKEFTLSTEKDSADAPTPTDVESGEDVKKKEEEEIVTAVTEPVEQEIITPAVEPPPDLPESPAVADTAVLLETLISKATPKAEPEPTEPYLRSVRRCHIGAVRGRNEDSCLTFGALTGGQEPLMPFGLYIVADGMGGHHAGHRASKMASRIIADRIFSETYLPLMRQMDENRPAAPTQPIQEVLLDAVAAANMTLFNHEPGKDSGTTVTAALIFGRRLYLAHVGDSRAYLLHDDKFQTLTTDHSYVRRLQDVGQLTAEEAAIHPNRNVLYRAVGQGEELEIDTFTRALPTHGKLLLCSDGLWGLVPDEVMQTILEEDKPLQAKADQLIELALQAGGHDNITAVLVEFLL